MAFEIKKEGGVKGRQEEEKARHFYDKAVHDWGEFQRFAGSHEDEKSAEEVHSTCTRLGLDEGYHHLRHVDKSQSSPSGPLRILYLTTVQALYFMTDRWNFHMYLGLASQPLKYRAIMWGVGMPGFHVNETLRDNILRWFQDPHLDVVVTTWNYHRTYRGHETWRDWKFSSMYADMAKSHGSAGVGGGKRHRRHKDLPALEDVSHLQAQRRAREFHSQEPDSKKVTGLLPGQPLVVLFVNEIEAKDERDLEEILPHVVFCQVEQQLGSLKQVDVCGNPRGGPREKGPSCYMHPALRAFLANTQQQHALLAYMPQGVHAPFFAKPLGPRDLVDSCDRQAKRGDVLIVGALNHHLYPLRSAALTVKKAYTRVMAHYPHPGYREEKEWHDSLTGMCHAFFAETLPQQRNYIRQMKTSRLCLVGSRAFNVGHEDVCNVVSWTLRKYVEAMGAGCVVIGDLPSDAALARHVPVRLTGQLPLELAWSVEAALDQYNAPESTQAYQAHCRAARAEVLANYTFPAVLEGFFSPAVAAHRRGLRGVFADTRSAIFVRGNDDCRASEGAGDLEKAGNRSLAVVLPS